MKDLFYHAKFCAECGSAINEGHFWRARYFCDHCDQALGRSALRRRRIALALMLLIVGALFNGQTNRATLTPQPPIAPLEADNIPEVSSPEPVVNPSPAFCGARTRKGTPCRRRVLPGERCYQHQGMPSIIDRSK